MNRKLLILMLLPLASVEAMVIVEELGREMVKDMRRDMIELLEK